MQSLGRMTKTRRQLRCWRIMLQRLLLLLEGLLWLELLRLVHRMVTTHVGPRSQLFKACSVSQLLYMLVLQHRERSL